MTAYLKNNSLLISVPNPSVTLLIPDTHQAKAKTHLRNHGGLTVTADPMPKDIKSIPRHLPIVQQAERESGRNDILKALAGTSWGQQKETLLMSYKAMGRSIINYAAPIWSPNRRDINYRSIQYAQNEGLRIELDVIKYPVSITCRQRLKCRR